MPLKDNVLYGKDVWLQTHIHATQRSKQAGLGGHVGASKGLGRGALGQGSSAPRLELHALALLLNPAAESTYTPRKYMSGAHSVLGALPSFGDRGGQSPDFMQAAV